MRADSHTVLDPDGPGRDSIRIRSKKTWKHGVYVYVQAFIPDPELVSCIDKPAIGSTSAICLKDAQHGRLLGLSSYVRFPHRPTVKTYSVSGRRLAHTWGGRFNLSPQVGDDADC
jgi:hypothetical protein